MPHPSEAVDTIMKHWLVFASLALAISAVVQAAEGDASAGKTKSVTCAACHGADGNSVNPIWPKLAGQHPSYMAKQIMDFKKGERKDPTMTAMAAPLSDQDIADLAAYFSAEKHSVGTTDPQQVAVGERIYRGGNAAAGVAACSACHGPAGTGNAAAQFPSLGGQHAAYVEKALKDFRAGARVNDANGMMRGVAARLTDQEILAVAQYIQGLHP